jgi:hypothetical protein
MRAEDAGRYFVNKPSCSTGGKQYDGAGLF